MNKMKKGFNTIEISLASGFIALMIFGVFWLKDNFYKPFIANNEVKSMLAAISITKNPTGTNTASPIPDVSLIEKVKVIYKKNVVANDYLFSLRKNVTFEPISAGDNSYIKVSYNDMDWFYCEKLAIAFKDNVDSITVNRTVVYNNIPSTIPMSLDFNSLARACRSSENSDFVQTFNFKR